MPTAKKGAKAKNGKKDSKKDTHNPLSGPECDPMVLFRNYSKQCEKIGIPVHDSVRSALCNEENANRAIQLFIAGDERQGTTSTTIMPAASEFKPVLLEAAGCRALSLAILGKCDCIDGCVPYTAFKDIRIWTSNIGDEGASAIARILREHGCGVSNLAYVELPNNNIGAQGAEMLARSLSCGMNKTLLTLNLDFNSSLGSPGVSILCKGLSTNTTLRKLSLQYCGFESDCGESIRDLLSSSGIGITHLNLMGNRLRGGGLLNICSGLEVNTTLKSLGIADNSILETDLIAIEALASILSINKVLTSIDLMHNMIGSKGGMALLNGIKSNMTITSFKVDTNLNSELYNALTRIPPIEKKGKIKKKGGGKKKKK